MIKNILLTFIFLFHFSTVYSYQILAQSDSIFDDSDLEDIEGLDGREEDSVLEEEFGDLSDEPVIDNFEVDDFEVVDEVDEEDEKEEDGKDSEGVIDESIEEDDFNKEDYEEISDRPDYEVVTDEELEQEFLDVDGESDSDTSNESDNLDIDEDLIDEDSDSYKGNEGDSTDTDEDSEQLEDMELVEDEEEEEDTRESKEDSELEQLQEDIEQMQDEEESLSEDIKEIADEEQMLKDEEDQIEIEPIAEGMDDQEQSLDLEDPEESFEEPTVEGLPVDEEEDRSSELNLITNIRYITEEDKIIIDTSEIASYQERTNTETNQLIIEILQSELGKNLHWPYPLRDFNTDFGFIKADQKDSSTVRVIIQIKEGADFPKTTLSQDGNQIIIGYGSIVNNDIVSDEYQTSMEDLDSRSILPAKTLEELYFGDIEFSGTPLSFHVIDAPIKQVLRFISEESGLNMVIDESVSGTVTLKLEDVPWDQALHTIFKVKSLGYTRDGSVITILPLSKIEERTQKLAEISRRQKALSPFETKVIPVMFAKAVDVESKVKEFSTPQAGTNKGGKIIVHEGSNTLVVVDTAEAIKNIESMVRFLDKSPQQVMIETKIVEVTKSFAKNFKFNWNLGGNFPVRVGADGLLNFLINGLNNTSYTYGLDNQSGLKNTFTMNGFPFLGDLDATLNLAEDDGSAQVLSTTKILTRSGQQASITKDTPIIVSSGGDTILNAAAGGSGTEQQGAATQEVATSQGTGVVQSAKTESITLNSDVTPVVTSSGSIAIKVKITLGTPGGQGGAFKTDRTANTDVLTKDGQTIVVSGIYQKNETETNSSIPWLKNIPLLGWMFKSKNSNFSESEMLMFVTPNLIEQ